ncbi:MAG: hypothetical protein DRN37_00165, partial [Thermoplasmata archaeon]
MARAKNNIQGPTTGSRMNNRAYRRQMLRQIVKVVSKQEGGSDDLYRRYVQEEDQFTGMYGELRLVEPAYTFEKLYVIYEESDILQSCVDTMQKNVDGFGYDLQFLGDDVKEKDSPEAQAEFQRAKDFFDQANENQSWTTIRKLAREDYEVIGNSAFELVRNLRGELVLVYHLPFKRIRVCSLQGREIRVPVTLRRNGKDITVKIKRKFRRYAQISVEGKRIRWFKEYGDPRHLDAKTGEYTNTKPKMPATELLHFKQSFGGKTYGLPRWIGAVPQVLGRRSASYINNDLFENQGIPPLAIMVSGGVLTDESLADLEEIMRGARGVDKWNRVLILESNVEGLGLDEKGNAKIELKDLSRYRKEDQMFGKYTKDAAEDVRHTFRLPP